MGSRSMGGHPRDVRGWVGFPDECRMDGQSGERERGGFLSGIFDGEKEGTVSSVASGMGWERGLFWDGEDRGGYSYYYSAPQK